MLIQISHIDQNYTVDLSKPIDISIPLKNGIENPNCFNAPVPQFSPLQDGNFIGDTRNGSPVNFYNVHINPHGNGTHTECVGHISEERFYINDCLKQFHSIGILISITPMLMEDDYVITKESIEKELVNHQALIHTLIIRTLPNSTNKLTQNYTNTNPIYFTDAAMQFIVEINVQHLIVDLPSVDKEKDEGKLSTHHIFWNYAKSENVNAEKKNENILRTNATITEMVFVPSEITDGIYFVNTQIMPIELDASNSKIILFALL